MLGVGFGKGCVNKNVEPGNKGIRKHTQTKTRLFNHTSNYLINNIK